jgi:hypothetical protein
MPRVGFGEDDRPLPSGELVEIARSIAGNRLLLSFSGRDSLAAWLYLRGEFEIIPYFCYTVPGLSYDNEMLDYYERHFQTHIIRLPHPRTYELLNAGAYQPLDTWRTIYFSQLPRFEFADIEKRLVAQFGLGENYLSVVGIKAADNLMRLRLIRQMGPIGLKKRRYYYAIWDWKTADVAERVGQSGLKLSRSYRLFGSTGDGIDYNSLKILKEQSPTDYDRILEMFPMADIELFRYDKVKASE